MLVHGAADGFFPVPSALVHQFARVDQLESAPALKYKVELAGAYEE